MLWNASIYRQQHEHGPLELLLDVVPCMAVGFPIALEPACWAGFASSVVKLRSGRWLTAALHCGTLSVMESEDGRTWTYVSSAASDNSSWIDPANAMPAAWVGRPSESGLITVDGGASLMLMFRVEGPFGTQPQYWRVYGDATGRNWTKPAPFDANCVQDVGCWSPGSVKPHPRELKNGVTPF